MNYIQAERVLQKTVIWVFLQVYHDFLHESLKSGHILVLDKLKYSGAILRYSLLQVLILLLVEEFFCVSSSFTLSILVNNAIIDKWLQLFSCLNESHPQVIALNANLFEELI